jgi:deoxyadenosine/deoxycytidine kinase
MKSHSYRVVIDGNIGSGKTTQMKLLSKEYKTRCEPIEDWPLEEFYKDKNRWAFLLQMTILRSFVEDLHTQIWERSPESSKCVFWKMLRDNGIGTDDEDSVYSFFYDRNAWSPDVHVYIRTSPEKCYERIQKRHQEGDSSISLEYLKQVHKYYEDYISSKNNVIVIDGEGTPEKIQDDIKDVLESYEKRNEM